MPHGWRRPTVLRNSIVQFCALTFEVRLDGTMRGVDAGCGLSLLMRLQLLWDEYLGSLYQDVEVKAIFARTVSESRSGQVAFTSLSHMG
jgi:hypothetical protein